MCLRGLSASGLRAFDAVNLVINILDALLGSVLLPGWRWRWRWRIATLGNVENTCRCISRVSQSSKVLAWDLSLIIQPRYLLFFPPIFTKWETEHVLELMHDVWCVACAWCTHQCMYVSMYVCMYVSGVCHVNEMPPLSTIHDNTGHPQYTLT